MTNGKLATWLETVCCILDQYAIPGLNKAALFSEELESLTNEKIADQRSIISLQGLLIEKHENSLNSVQSTFQTTVETEMKTYALAVTRSCSSALPPKKIEAAVKKVADKEGRSRNVIVYGLEGTAQEDILARIQSTDCSQ